MKKINYIICLLIGLFCFNNNGYSQKAAGESFKRTHHSVHPYTGNTSNEYQKVWSEEITVKDAVFVAVHFKKFELSAEDYLVVRCPNNTREWKYTQEDAAERIQDFWSIFIYGESLVVEIFSKNSIGAFGYEIDQVHRGFSLFEQEEEKIICGNDDTNEAVCYQITHPTAYDRAQKVARLLTMKGGSSFWGTGWLLGSDGHLMTNEHVITNQTEANNTTYEFDAEAAICLPCNTGGGCAGTVWSTSATFVADDDDLDYCLVKLPTLLIFGTKASDVYGYLQLRSQGPVIGERIYIPQHPAGWAKRIAIFSDNANDTGGVARIQSLTEDGCSSNPNNDEVGYWADTQGGSSGSPVLSYNDNTVIALHHCKGNAAGCGDMNRGINITKIITDLGSNLPPDAIYCPTNVIVSQDVPAGDFDIQSSGSTIELTNTINSTGTGLYDSDKITLKAGFKASSGSSVRVFVDGCN